MELSTSIRNPVVNSTSDGGPGLVIDQQGVYGQNGYGAVTIGIPAANLITNTTKGMTSRPSRKLLSKAQEETTKLSPPTTTARTSTKATAISSLQAAEIDNHEGYKHFGIGLLCFVMYMLALLAGWAYFLHDTESADLGYYLNHVIFNETFIVADVCWIIALIITFIQWKVFGKYL